MTHLQNKSHGFQLIPKSRNQYAYSRSKYKCGETQQPEPEVYYSDEENNLKLEIVERTQIEDIINGAQGDFDRKEDGKNKKMRTTFKKKSAKNKMQSKQIEPILLPLHAKVLLNAPVESSSALIHQQPFESMKCKPVVFETNQQSYFNSLESVKARVQKNFESSKIGNSLNPSENPQDRSCFKCISDYRAYFQAETNIKYDEYIVSCQNAKKMAVFSKINQLIRLQKKSKHQLLKKLEQSKFRYKEKTNNIIRSIAEESHVQGQLPNKKVVNAACTNKLNENFGMINQFLAQNYSSAKADKNDELPFKQNTSKPSHIAMHVSPDRSLASEDSQKGISRDARRKEKPKAIEHILQPQNTFGESYSQYQIHQTNKNLELQLNKMNDRKKILASIQIVNKQCQQQEKHLRLETERQEREREERQKSKSAKKEQASNVSSTNEGPKYEGSEENQSERKRQQSLRQAQWFNYHKTNPKIKRLQILNRYHYNPFEENEGEDQCQLWKKLMSMEIKNLKSDNPSIKSQEINQNLIDELLREVEEFDRERDKMSKVPPNDIFILQTNYKPSENMDKSKEEEEELARNQQRQAKEKKSNKKQKKSQKHKKSKHGRGKQSTENKSSPNHEPQIGQFLNLGSTSVKKYENQAEEHDYIEPYPAKRHQIEEHPMENIEAEEANEPSQSQNNQEAGNFELVVRELIASKEQAFNFDQLVDLQGYDEIVQSQKVQSEPEPFSAKPIQFFDIDYFEGMNRKQKGQWHK